MSVGVPRLTRGREGNLQQRVMGGYGDGRDEFIIERTVVYLQSLRLQLSVRTSSSDRNLRMDGCMSSRGAKVLTWWFRFRAAIERLGALGVRIFRQGEYQVVTLELPALETGNWGANLDFARRTWGPIRLNLSTSFPTKTTSLASVLESRVQLQPLNTEAQT